MTDDVYPEHTLRGWAEVAACIPGFDLYAFSRLERLSAYRDPDTDELIVELEAHAAGFAVTLRIFDASGTLPRPLVCHEMFVDDLRGRQLETIRYKIYEESGAMRLECRDAEFAVRALT